MTTLSERWARLLYPQTMWVLVGLTVVVVALAILVRLPSTLALDTLVTKRLQILNTPFLTWLGKWSTFMGNSLTLVVVCCLVSALFLLANLPQAGLATPLSLLSLAINIGLKNMVDRRRPGQDEVRVEMHLPRWGFSFPSGHSMGSAAVYWFIAFLVYLHVTAPWLKPVVLAILLPLPLLVGVSRIYVGAHWFSDVVAGWAGGLLLVVTLGSVYPPVA